MFCHTKKSIIVLYIALGCFKLMCAKEFSIRPVTKGRAQYMLIMTSVTLVVFCGSLCNPYSSELMCCQMIHLENYARNASEKKIYIKCVISSRSKDYMKANVHILPDFKENLFISNQIQVRYS